MPGRLQGQGRFVGQPLQRLGDHRSARMGPGLGLGEQSLVHQRLDKGVVLGQLGQVAGPVQVGPGVADVEQRDLVMASRTAAVVPIPSVDLVDVLTSWIFWLAASAAVRKADSGSVPVGRSSSTASVRTTMSLANSPEGMPPIPSASAISRRPA